MTFILTWINVIATAGMKGLVVFFIFRPHRWDIPALILMMYVPQLVHVSYTFQNSKSAELWQILTSLFKALAVIFVALGVKRGSATIARYPALVLMPVFTFWTFGGAGGTNTNCSYQRNSPHVKLSFR